MSELASDLTEHERELRDRFVEQYLIDYSAVDAAIRLGYADGFASNFAKKFLTEPYTLQRIAERERELGLEDEQSKHRHRVVAGLYREAHNKFNSGSARVSAFSTLAKILGLEAPAKVEQVLVDQTAPPSLGHLSVADIEQLKRMLYANPAATAKPH